MIPSDSRGTFAATPRRSARFRRLANPLHRRVDDHGCGGHDGLRAQRAAGAQARPQLADEDVDGGPVVGAQRARADRVRRGGIRQIDRALHRRGALAAAELGEDQQEVVAGILGHHVHGTERRGDRIDGLVARDPEQCDRQGTVIANGSIRLGDEALFAGGGIDDRARAAQAADRADHRDDRADRDLVAADESARIFELVAVDPRAVAAARSSTSIRSPVRRTRACMRETYSCSSVTVALRDRPKVTSTPSGKSIVRGARCPPPPL